ncbi:MAG TPA: FAD-dependent oxidoreductase, partial [Pyrinomonadaceae bacterium]|nr:FAD-dependent oxidoreductase [Pyrinomonadaceae bacterium]
ETDINIKMSLYSLDFFRNWEFDCEYEPRGYLFFATNEARFDYLKSNVRKQRSLGVKDVEIVDAKTVGEIVPGMNCGDITGGSFGKHDGFINPLAVMRGFTEGALRGGAKIEFGARVVSIGTENGRVRTVRTEREEIECESVVLCTGAIAKALAATAGVDLPVEPQRRQIVWARTEQPLPLDLPMVIDIGSGFHFRPASHHHSSGRGRAFERPPKGGTQNDHDVLFAYPDPDEPSSANTNFDDAFIEKVYERAKLRAGFLFESEVVREKCRAGLYENTPDHHAILGGCEVSGLYLANGFSGHGVMHSPATGRALSEIILDGKASFLDVNCLALERFAKGEMLHETAFI